MIVAALYIDPRGPYPSIPDVDAWDARRDARLYEGPHPVVAHPPCGPWGRLRHLSRRDDPALALRALEQVRRWGGVLEHPAGSLLWRAADLPGPWCLPDAWGGYTIEICQGDWGHACRKRTWLYLVGVPRSALVWPAPREPTHWIAGGRTPRPAHVTRGGKRPQGILAASAQIRRRTPPALAHYLVGLARASRRAVAA